MWSGGEENGLELNYFWPLFSLELQRLVKTKDTERFLFQYDDCIEAMKRTNTIYKLRQNKTGFYRKVKLFPHNETIKWRGKVGAAYSTYGTIL